MTTGLNAPFQKTAIPHERYGPSSSIATLAEIPGGPDAATQASPNDYLLNNGSCIRLRPEHANHVWAYDFVTDRTANGKAFRMLTVVNEYTRECLAITVERRLSSTHVLETLAELFIHRRTSQHIRSDNGSEFCAEAVKSWLRRLHVKTLFIEPGSPRENGYVESLNGKLWDKLLNGEVFSTPKEAQVLIAD